jgi:hypothetical protein
VCRDCWGEQGRLRHNFAVHTDFPTSESVFWIVKHKVENFTESDSRNKTHECLIAVDNGLRVNRFIPVISTRSACGGLGQQHLDNRSVISKEHTEPL